MSSIVDVTSCAQFMIQWSDRTDINVILLLEFIGLAGRMASQSLRVPAMETSVNLIASNGTLQVPQDFIQLRSMVGPNRDVINAMQMVSWDKFVDLTNDTDNPSAVPRYFARRGDKWYVYPTPTDGETFICHYYNSIPELTLNEPTNWLMNMAPQVYLYGGLAQLYTWSMDEERTAYWEKKFTDQLSLIQTMADAAEYSGTRLTVDNLESR